MFSSSSLQGCPAAKTSCRFTSARGWKALASACYHQYRLSAASRVVSPGFVTKQDMGISGASNNKITLNLGENHLKTKKTTTKQLGTSCFYLVSLNRASVYRFYVPFFFLNHLTYMEICDQNWEDTSPRVISHNLLLHFFFCNSPKFVT